MLGAIHLLPSILTTGRRDRSAVLLFSSGNRLSRPPLSHAVCHFYEFGVTLSPHSWCGIALGIECQADGIPVHSLGRGDLTVVVQAVYEQVLEHLCA